MTPEQGKQIYFNGAGEHSKRLFKNGKEYDVFELETATGKQISLAHHEAHEGRHFIANAVNNSMGDGDILSIAFKVPAGTRWPHMIVEWKSKAAAHLEIVRGGAWSPESGRPINITNNNHNNTTRSVLQHDLAGTFTAGGNRLIADVATFTGGEIIDEDYHWADKKSGGEARGDVEHICKADTTYLIRVIADAATNAAIIKLFWYEYVFKS